MKVLQKHLKKLFIFMAFLACSFMFALTPLKLAPVKAAGTRTMSVVNGQDKQPTFKAVKIPTKVDYSKSTTEELKIPFLDGETGEYYIRVVDRGGFVHDYKVSGSKNGAESDEFFEKCDGQDCVKIKDKSTNTYTIYYIKIDSEKNTTYFSNRYKVDVIGAKYVISTNQVVEEDGKLTETNLKELFPTQQLYNKDTPTTFTVPQLYGYQSVDDGETKKYEKATISVSLNGNKVSEEIFNSSTRLLTFKEEGRYVITYTYQEAAPYECVINVDSNFVAPKTSDNQVVVQTPGFGSAKLGDKDVVLPNPTVNYRVANFNKPNDVAKNVTQIKIYKEDDLVDGQPRVMQTLTDNDFTFNFTIGKDGFGENLTYDDLVGNYKVEYTIKEYYNAEPIVEEYTWGYFSKNSINPTVKAVYDYEIFDGESNFVASEEGDNAVKSAVSEIKAEYQVQTDGSILFPAVYFNSPVDDYTDLMVVRYFQEKESGKRYYIDGVKIDYAQNQYVQVSENDGFNFALTTEEGDNKVIVPNDKETQKTYFERLAKSAAFKFNKDGSEFPTEVYDKEYRLCYEVKVQSSYQQNSQSYSRRSALYEQSSTEYGFKIVSTTEQNTNLYVNITNKSDKTVKTGDELEYTVNSNDNIDLRLVNAMYYSDKDFSTLENWDEIINEARTKANENGTKDGFIGKDNLVNLLTETLKTKLNNDAKVGKFDLVDGSTTKFKTTVPEGYEGKLYILAITINDNGQVAVDTTSVVIADTDENVPPSIESVTFDTDTQGYFNDDSKVFGQGDEVIIPTVKFVDYKTFGNTASNGDKNQVVDARLSTSVFYYIIPEGTLSTKVEDLTFHKNFKYPDEYSFYNGVVSGKIKTTAVGTYVVVYTATDDAGNTTVTHYTFKVTSTAQPLMDVFVSAEGTGTSYTATVGDIVYVTPHVYDGNDNSKEIVDKDKLKIDISLKNVNGKHVEEADGGYQLFTAGRYTFVVNATWTDSATEHKDHVIPTYEFTVTVEAKKATDSTASISWDENFDLPQYYAFESAEGENKQLALPQWVATQEGYNVTETKLLYKRQNASSWSEATLDTATKKWLIKTSGIGVYNLSYEVYTDAETNNYSHQEKTITFGDNLPPTFSINAGALENKITYTDEEINIQIKFYKLDKVMTITATQGNKKLYTWTSYASENDIKNNVNFKINENTEDPDQGTRTNYSWSSLSIKLTDSEGAELTKEESQDGNYTVYDYTISSIGLYKFVFTAEDTQNNLSDPYEIAFSVTNQAEPTRLSNSQIGIILIVVSSIILIGVILFFLFTGKGDKKQKSVSTLTETTKSKKKSNSKKDKKDGEVEQVENKKADEKEDKDAE